MKKQGNWKKHEQQQKPIWREKATKQDLTPNYSNVLVLYVQKHTLIQQSWHNGWAAMEHKSNTCSWTIHLHNLMNIFQ